MQKPVPGQRYGCSDGGSPNGGAWALSRVYDMLYAAYCLGGNELKQRVWLTLAPGIRQEFNYAQWAYMAG